MDHVIMRVCPNSVASPLCCWAEAPREFPRAVTLMDCQMHLEFREGISTTAAELGVEFVIHI